MFRFIEFRELCLDRCELWAFQVPRHTAAMHATMAGSAHDVKACPFTRLPH